MKKTYITPTVEVIKVDAANIIAASALGISDTYVNTNELGVQQGRENNSVFDRNIWDQGW